MSMKIDEAKIEIKDGADKLDYVKGVKNFVELGRVLYYTPNIADFIVYYKKDEGQNKISIYPYYRTDIGGRDVEKVIKEFYQKYPDLDDIFMDIKSAEPVFDCKTGEMFSEKQWKGVLAPCTMEGTVLLIYSYSKRKILRVFNGSQAYNVLRIIELLRNFGFDSKVLTVNVESLSTVIDLICQIYNIKLSAIFFGEKELEELADSISNIKFLMKTPDIAEPIYEKLFGIALKIVVPDENKDKNENQYTEIRRGPIWEKEPDNSELTLSHAMYSDIDEEINWTPIYNDMGIDTLDSCFICKGKLYLKFLDGKKPKNEEEFANEFRIDPQIIVFIENTVGE